MVMKIIMSNSQAAKGELSTGTILAAYEKIIA
jgi:hypothetical protein